jgi:hypothetical protein
VLKKSIAPNRDENKIQIGGPEPEGAAIDAQMLDQGVVILVLGKNVEITLWIGLGLETDVVCEHQVQSVGAGSFLFYPSHLVMIFMDLPG